ncbi:MAG: GAF domain-containing protein [Gammaproteobacteria bacterium]|nr:GAF domain-containing protein [Gammaproteobacteria bacterium]
MAVDYDLLQKQFEGLAAADDDPLALSANFVGLLYSELPDINWLGIYVVRGQELVLGPFQGLPACVRIPFGQGVCGTAAKERKTVRVDNVHEFDGHIACDPASESELVVPLVAGRGLVGVLDIDSPFAARFTARDQAGIESLCAAFVKRLGDEPARSDGFI